MQRPVLGFVTFTLLAGCSTDVDDLFGGGSNGDGGAGGATTTAVTATSTTSGPGSTTGTTSGPTTSSASTSTSGPTTTSAVTTGQTTVTTGPEPVVVDCRGGGACPVEGGGVCCWDNQQQSGECVPAAEQCQGSQFEPLVAISCQLPEQCPNQVCCAHRAFPSNQSPYIDTTCDDQCENPDRVVCDPNAPQCPMGASCIQSSLLPAGYFICSPN